MKIKQVVPFEPKSTESLPDGQDWVFQVKWDGVRMLTYYDGQEVHLFNRRLNERTAQYPELVDIKKYCSASSVILDGEIIALHNGKPSFYEVMRRDGSRLKESLALAQKKVSITYMIFDILYLNEEWVTGKTLTERQQLLDKIINPLEYVQIVNNFPSGAELFEVIKAQEMEGIIGKNVNSTYSIGGKDGRWLKKKYYRDLIAAVGGVTMRNGVVNSLLLGLYDTKGAFWYIGHAGTGKLTTADWRALTEMIQPLIIAEKPFVNRPGRMKESIWLQPALTVKVQYAEWIEGHTLRQPSIQGFVSVPPEDCLFEG